MAKTGCIGMAIDYRICPENVILDSVQDCVKAYKYIMDNYNTNNIFLIGDSAGGCLVLLSLQSMVKNGIKQPKGGIILSAVCDLSCSFASFESNKETDPILNKSGISAGNQMGLGNIDINGNDTGMNVDAKNPLYSPLYGSFKGICPLYFNSGMHELFFDENVATMEKAKDDGVDIEYEWNEYLLHSTIIHVALDVPEAFATLTKVAAWINKQRLQ